MSTVSDDRDSEMVLPIVSYLHQVSTMKRLTSSQCTIAASIVWSQKPKNQEHLISFRMASMYVPPPRFVRGVGRETDLPLQELPPSIFQLEGLRTINIMGQKLGSREVGEREERGEAGDIVSPVYFTSALDSVTHVRIKRSKLDLLDPSIQCLTNLIQVMFVGANIMAPCHLLRVARAQ